MGNNTICTCDKNADCKNYTINGKPNAGPNSRLMLWLLKMGGEPWLWATNLTELSELLIAHGWQYSPLLTGDKVKRGIEYFACAENIQS